MSAREAADVIWTLASERTYLALVRDRGWKPGHYERWVAEQLVAALSPSGSDRASFCATALAQPAPRQETAL